MRSLRGHAQCGVHSRARASPVMDAGARAGIGGERSAPRVTAISRARGRPLQADLLQSDGVAEFTDGAVDSDRAARRVRSRGRRSTDAGGDACRGESRRPGSGRRPRPRCLVHRRVSEPGGVRQAFLVFFDAPAIAQFRRQIGLDPDALSPIMFVAGAGADFNSWLPQRVNADADCLAPVEIGTHDESLRHSGEDNRRRDHDAGWISRARLS